MRTLLSILLWIYFAVCMLLFFVIIMLVYMITAPFDRHRRIPNRVLKGLAWMMLKPIPGWRIQVEGIDRYRKGRPTIFVANHQSFLDLPLIYLLPWTMKWVAKKSMFAIPLLGWMAAMTGHLGIDRESQRSVKRLDRLVEPIRGGIPAMIFPEGTRSNTGELKRFKNGAFRLAKRYNFIVQPLVLDGGSRALPSGEWRFNLNQRLNVSVLEPVDPEQISSERALKDHIFEQIEQELARIREQEIKSETTVKIDN